MFPLGSRFFYFLAPLGNDALNDFVFGLGFILYIKRSIF